MKLSIFLPLATFLSLTFAEDYSPCVSRCLDEGAAVAGCISVIDYKCTCTSPAFRDTVQACLKYACTAEDAVEAGKLHEERCGTAPPS
ncbi:hypothetical protein N7474_007473 [Penicillium riverlandense]|uniref:uncharacterized protein n=1 Tax=Penicillium riverlandense TaxID=1903569 RepID=UPI0025469887|nr:uncharacterized protein N7474_007473 [Penicillium riverlandense]KAJ5815696.1 hypothetical protein N7474_007473 [Penicillium riverlandense]